MSCPAISRRSRSAQGIEAWLRAVFACNQYIDAQAPWALRKTDPERMTAVLATLYEAIADLAIAIQPVIPASAGELLDAMGVPAGERDLCRARRRDRYARLAALGLHARAADAPSSRGSEAGQRPMTDGQPACSSIAIAT